MEKEIHYFKIRKLNKGDLYGASLKDGFVYTSKAPCDGFEIHIPWLGVNIFLPRDALDQKETIIKVDLEGKIQ